MFTVPAHWPQWLVFISLALRAVIALLAFCTGQYWFRVPVTMIALYTAFLVWALWAGGFWSAMP